MLRIGAGKTETLKFDLWRKDMTSVVRNTENERLEPIGIGPIKIGRLDKEEGAEAQEIPGFIPIIHELLALVGYWQRRATNRRFYSWLDIQSNPGLSPLVEFARHRVAQIAEQIGEDEVNKVLEETLVAMDKEFGDDIAWATFLKGKPLEHITRLQPQDSEGYRYRAFVYQQLGQSQEALADYDQAINLDPGHVGGLQSRARVLERFREASHADSHEAR